MPYTLRSLKNPAGEVQIETTPILVGRSKENHIKLSDPSGSRRHAQISLVNGEPVVIDLNSTMEQQNRKAEHRLSEKRF